MKKLVLIHGRSQEDKDAATLKQSWVDALDKGLQKSQVTVPLTDDGIRFPYYGNTLRDMCEGKDDIAEVIVKGAQDAEARDLLDELLLTYLDAVGGSDEEVEAELAADPANAAIERGPQNWGWVQAVLRVIDKHTPGGKAMIALVTNDVHQYLGKDTFRTRVEAGIRGAFASKDDDYIVVSHSLGTIVAYKFLQALSAEGGWRVPLFVTLGSPLGIRAIRKRLRPIGHPSCVGQWFNARDPDDVVALYALNSDNFGVTPAITDKSNVDNWTDNQHSIGGYLDDKEVARRIYDALL